MLKPNRRHGMPLILLAALCTGLISTAFAAVGNEAADGQLINIDVKDAPVEQVLRMLAKAANVNIIISHDVTGVIPAVTLRDVTVDDALRAIATSQGFYWYRDNNIYTVSKQPRPAASAPQETASASSGAATQASSPAINIPHAGPVVGNSAPAVVPPPLTVVDSTPAAGTATAAQPKIETKMIVLQFADAEQLAYMFGGTVCSGGTASQVFGNMSSSSDRIKNGVSRGGRGLSAAGVFAGGYGAPTSGNSSALGLNQDFGDQGGGGRSSRGGGRSSRGGDNQGGTGTTGRGSRGGTGGGGGGLGDLLPGDMEPPTAFMPQNALLVRGTQEDIDRFREILDLLDKPSKQVEIAAKFIEVQTTADKAFGIDWSTSNGSLEFFNQGFAPGEAVNNVVRFARGRFEAQLNALLSSGRATVINEPHVITMNNQFAEINFYTEIPYFSAQVSYNQFGTREVDFTSEFITVENSLWVVPRINADDSVTVYLEPTLEDTVGEVTGPNGESIPIVTSQYVSTQVRVGDGETIVLGGLIRKDESINLRETPLLSKLPILGRLFQSRSTSKRNSELLVFVTPRIVRDVPAQ
ncbi:MAG: hypothetical protein ABFE07_15445 [Armatimonadia bacterium]